jgi:hypothetical protein
MLTRADIDDLKRTFIPAAGPPADDVPMPNEYPESADGEPVVDTGTADGGGPAPMVLVCPPDWRGLAIPPMRWLAMQRIPADDTVILSGDGGGGKRRSRCSWRFRSRPAWATGSAPPANPDQ